MTAPGTNPSHLLLYPLSHIDYSSPPALNIDRLMQHVCNSVSLSYSVQDVMADAEQYRRSTGSKGAGGGIAVPSGVTSSIVGNISNPVVRRLLAASAAAAEAAAAAFKLKAAAVGGTAGASEEPAAAAAAVRGLTLQPSEPEQQQQHQIPAQQQLSLFLRRKLLPMRVAARRIATAEVWAQHVKAQQHKRQQGVTPAAAVAAEGGPSGATAAAAVPPSGTQEGGLKPDGTPSDAAAVAGSAAAAGNQGTPNGLPAAAAAAAAADDGVTTGAGDDWLRELHVVLQQQQGQIATRSKQLLMQQPFALSDLLAAFQQDHFPASQQLNIQVRGGGR
jgi:hypothetical protein